MGYTTVLVDLDHTLLDSDTSEVEAFADVAAVLGVSPDRELFETYRAINSRLWSRVEAGELSPDVVRLERFEQFTRLHALDADAHHLADVFADGLSEHGDLFPGSLATLESMAERATLSLVSNGVGEIQRRRIARLGLEEFFDTVTISGEVGHAKPDPRIFELALTGLGNPPRQRVVIVGDSLTSDMAGGHRVGIATCWFNPNGRSAPDRTVITHEVSRLAGVLDLLA